ncbi:MAG TPA: type VI secretion system tube protein Hcp [Polyangiaceae bacterium]
MAVDMFLKIESLEGESQDKTHKGEIQILGFSWFVSQTGTSGAGSGAGTGKSEFQDLEVRKAVDRASPVLMKLCASGAHLTSANLTVRKAGGDALEYLIIRLEDLMITSYHVLGEPKDDVVQEVVRINYTRAAIHYTPQESSGIGGAKVSGGWNLKENAAFDG